MRKLKLTQARRNRFLEALSESGSVTNAVTVAGTSRTRVYELRKTDVDFAFAWDEAEERAADRLHEEARRRAIEGVPELLVSAGKLVRDDNGQPIVVKRYPNSLLLALLKAHRPSRGKKFYLPSLQSAGDASRAMSRLLAAVSHGEITTEEAVELSRIIEAYLKAIEQTQRIMN